MVMVMVMVRVRVRVRVRVGLVVGASGMVGHELKWFHLRDGQGYD